MSQETLESEKKMSQETLELNVDDPELIGGDQQVNVTVMRGDQPVFKRRIRVFSEEDAISISNGIVSATELKQVDVDQALAEELGQIRTRILRERAAEGDAPAEAQNDTPAEERTAVPRYRAVLPGAPG